MEKVTCMQPSKLKLLLSHHLATNSFGLGRLFYKSSRQLQNFRRHGVQNGPNLEGWCAKIEPKSKRKAKNAWVRMLVFHKQFWLLLLAKGIKA